MNARNRFLLKLLSSIILALLAAWAMSYNFISFSLVFLILGWALCPVRTLHPERKQ